MALDQPDEFHFTASLATVAWVSGPARDLALQNLIKHRIFELPKLINVMPPLFEIYVETISNGVERLRKQSGDRAPRAYAETMRNSVPRPVSRVWARAWTAWVMSIRRDRAPVLDAWPAEP